MKTRLLLIALFLINAVFCYKYHHKSKGIFQHLSKQSNKPQNDEQRFKSNKEMLLAQSDQNYQNYQNQSDENDIRFQKRKNKQEIDPNQPIFVNQYDEEGKEVRKAVITKQYSEQESQQYPLNQGGRGQDQYRSFYSGQFYLIQRDIYSKFSAFAGKVSFYLNNNALYYTIPGVTSDKEDNYRNVGGSIDLDELVGPNESDEKLRNGVCCESLGIFKPFINAEFTQSQQQQQGMKDLEKSINNKLRSDRSTISNNNKVGVSADIRKLIGENQYQWQGFMCFGINLRINQEWIVDAWTICGPNVSDVAILKSMIKEFVVMKYYHKQNIFHLTFLVDSGLATEGRTDFMLKDYQWTWENESQWPEQCQERDIDQKYIQSPISINSNYFHDDLNQYLGNIQEKDVKDYFQTKSLGESTDKYQNVIQALNDYQSKNKVQLNFQNLKSSGNQQSYLKYFTFSGIHENMFIGDFGSLLIQQKDESVNYQLSNKVRKSDIEVKAFAMTFKTSVEHQISNSYNSDCELQIYLYESDDEICNKAMQVSKDSSVNDMGELMKIVLKQFYLGKYQSESDELYLAEYYISKCTQYVLTVPLIRKSNLAHNNQFVRSLMNEDIFEYQPTPNYLQDYLQMQLSSIQFSKDIVYNQQNSKNMDKECQSPGNFQCLLNQQNNQMTFFIYRGTQTKPPCNAAIHILMKNPYFISSSDLSLIQDQMFLYRSNSRNVRSKQPTNVGYSEMNKYGLMRMMDYSQADCKNEIESKEGYVQKKVERLYQTDFTSQNSEMKRQLEQMKQSMDKQYSESYKINKEGQSGVSNLQSTMNSYKKNKERSVRRMGFINPQLANDLIRMQKEGEGSFQQYSGEQGDTRVDYGNDDKSILYVNGKLASTVYGSLTNRESVKVKKVFKKYEQMQQKNNDNSLSARIGRVSVGDLKVVDEEKKKKKK